MLRETEHVRRFLNGYRDAFNEYQDILDRLYRSGNIEPKSPLLDGMPRSGKVFDMSDRIIISEEMAGIYRERLDELRKDMKAVRMVISRVLDPTNKAILVYKYLDFLTWAEISKILRLDKDLIYKRHQRTLEALAEVLYEND